MRSLTLLFALLTAAGCSSVLGFEDPSLAGGPPTDGPVIDSPPTDTPPTGCDACPFGCEPGTTTCKDGNLWVFTTNATSNGGFGAADGARATADSRCDAMYRVTFTARNCTHVRAVIQVDNISDTLELMAQTYQIPQNVEMLRATDAAPVSAKWVDFINPNVRLIAPVTPPTAPATAVQFWSGRGAGTSVQCTDWTSSSSAVSGNIGDAAQTNEWISRGLASCDKGDQRLLCVCW